MVVVRSIGFSVEAVITANSDLPILPWTPYKAQYPAGVIGRMKTLDRRPWVRTPEAPRDTRLRRILRSCLPHHGTGSAPLTPIRWRIDRALRATATALPPSASPLGTGRRFAQRM